MGKKRERERRERKAEEKEILSTQAKKCKISQEEKTVQNYEEVNLPSLKSSSIVNHVKNQEKRLIVVLEDAHLETVKWGKGFGILNVDEHSNLLRKIGKEFTEARPDITHQSLLMLLDSPLNRAGLLQVYIRTKNNVLIEVNPQTRIPRTFPRFAGLMVQLLHKFSIKASDSSVKLLKVIKNPITDHLPVGCRKICMSYAADKICKPEDLVPKTEEPICLVIGAVAKGAINPDYTEENIRLGNYPLSAALTCTKLCSAFENAWGVF